jgi:hypothetical protein
VCSRCRSRDVAPRTCRAARRVVTYTINHQRWMPGSRYRTSSAIVELIEQRGLRLTTNLVNVAPEAGDDRHAASGALPEDDGRDLAADLRARRLADAGGRADARAPARDRHRRRPVAPPRRVDETERSSAAPIISGVGQSQIGARLFRPTWISRPRPRSRAIADAGLTPDDIDGIASYPGAMGGAPPGFAGPGIVEVQDALGLSVELASPPGPKVPRRSRP